MGLSGFIFISFLHTYFFYLNFSFAVVAGIAKHLDLINYLKFNPFLGRGATGRDRAKRGATIYK